MSMMVNNVSTTHVKATLGRVIDELPIERVAQVLDFALFIKARQAQQRHAGGAKQLVQRLEDLWGDFWPEDESVDDFIHAVRHWRREDLSLHKRLQ